MVRTGERFGTEHLTNLLLGETTVAIGKFGHDRLPTFGVQIDESEATDEQKRVDRATPQCARLAVRVAALPAADAVGLFRRGGRAVRQLRNGAVDHLGAVAAEIAGMENAARSRNQDAFLQEDGVVIAATVAFGMGIDKPDVRFVLHADMPAISKATTKRSAAPAATDCRPIHSRSTCRAR
jgi:superfamily II DNA helicase RecQ